MFATLNAALLLNSTQFDAETYFPELVREYMARTNTYSKWYLEIKSRIK